MKSGAWLDLARLAGVAGLLWLAWLDREGRGMVRREGRVGYWRKRERYTERGEEILGYRRLVGSRVACLYAINHVLPNEETCLKKTL